MTQHLARIQFIPRQDIGNFYNFIAASDVVLDGLHVGGGMTTMDAFATDTPIATLPTENMRSRVASACYQFMEIEECIAVSKADYVEISVRPENDPSQQKNYALESWSAVHVCITI